MSQAYTSFEQLLDAYTVATRNHQVAIAAPAPGVPPFTNQSTVDAMSAQLNELRAKLIAMFNAPAPTGEPFDLERARKGDAIEHAGRPVHFVGVMQCGEVVTENADGLTIYKPEVLYMAPPKMRTVYANIYEIKGDSTRPIGYIYATQEHATLHASIGRALGVAVPMSIPE
jgi:hypothetical protein